MSIKVVNRLAGRARRDEESGFVMVFVVLALVALRGMGPRGLDGGRA